MSNRRRARLGLGLGVLGILALSGPATRAQPGFTTYLMGFLIRAPEAPSSGDTAPDLQAAHLAHLDAMWKDGLLLASGPIADASDLRRTLIFRGDDRQAIERRIADDPMVKAGHMRVELGPWIGPIGVGDEYRKRTATGTAGPDKALPYQLVLMRTVWTAGRLAQDEQLAHLRHMDAMAKAGKLAVAGPVLEGSDLAWVLVFLAAADEVDALVAEAPTVKTGKLIAERHPWMVAEGVFPAGFKVPLP